MLMSLAMIIVMLSWIEGVKPNSMQLVLHVYSSVEWPLWAVCNGHQVDGQCAV